MENPEDVMNKKRKLEDAEEPVAKRINAETFNLIDFSDEMLLAILKHLDSTSLIKLSRTCTRLRTLAEDHTHWVDVDFSAEPASCSELIELLFRDVCQASEIRSLKIRGQVTLYPQEKWKNQTVTENFIAQLGTKCPKIENLCVEDAFLDSKRVAVVNFPATLRSLTLRNCHLSTSNNNPRSSFFSKINFHFTNLEELAVERCNWFDTHDLIAFSKIPNLKYLSLRGCTSFKDFVPYGSIATRFGFQALEVLDVRDTPVTDSDIQCFNISKNLRELRLQCPQVPAPKEEEKPENVSEGDRPGTSGTEPKPPATNPTSTSSTNPISASVHVRTDRQVINLHLRPSRNNGRIETVRDGAPQNVEIPPPEEEVRQENAENDEEIQEAGAEFNAGNDNFRINIRNQNVRGRNVIHIVLQNNHMCNQNNNNENNGEGNQEGNRPAAAAAAEGEGQENAPAGENNAENPPPQNANEPPNPPAGDGGVQHYIMIRGIREGAENDNGDDVNPARIVQFIQFQRSHPLHMSPGPLNEAITDRGICSFGHSQDGARGGLVWIRMEPRSPTTQLESITVRDYKKVTDVALQHLSSCAPRLKFLDVIGTDVTEDGIEKFKLQKPECRVISNFGVAEEENLL
ncbi:uncharacterized protein LOC134833834 [Culicoides brevitarsis]|uniref:uncharacterized protein LOC134833834 n=1 Tax=Culicoides brevitarsis TaxID=469753 RepID=UPI00307BA339